jgi:hypothetical protein
MTAATDWIGAVGTVGTLSTGLVLFAGTIRDRHRAHANAVSVWTELEIVERDSFGWQHDDPAGAGITVEASIRIEDWSGLVGPFDFRLRIKNGGHQPVYGVRLHVELDQSDLPSGAYPILYNVLDEDLGILAPDAELPAQRLLMGAPHAGHDFRDALAKAMSFQLEFTDTDGREWSRDQRGRLKRIGASRRLLRSRRARTTGLA